MNINLYDEHGNDIQPPKCRCGKPSNALFTNSKYNYWICHECMYGKRKSLDTNMMYKAPDPNDPRLPKLKNEKAKDQQS